MITLTLIMVLIFGLALSFVIRVAVIALRSWLQMRWLKKHGTNADARILHIEVREGRGRFLPYAKLQLAVSTAEGNRFITSLESHFQAFELEGLAANQTVGIKYNPAAISQLLLVKKQKEPTQVHSLKWEPVSTAAYLAITQ